MVGHAHEEDWRIRRSVKPFWLMRCIVHVGFDGKRNIDGALAAIYKRAIRVRARRKQHNSSGGIMLEHEVDTRQELVAQDSDVLLAWRSSALRAHGNNELRQRNRG